jgi:hypothetical protein
MSRFFLEADNNRSIKAVGQKGGGPWGEAEKISYRLLIRIPPEFKAGKKTVPAAVPEVEGV